MLHLPFKLSTSQPETWSASFFGNTNETRRYRIAGRGSVTHANKDTTYRELWGISILGYQEIHIELAR